MATKATGISREFIIHPGEIISDMLTERGITQAELAKRTGVSEAFISGILSGKKSISANFAMALEYALSVPKSFWLNLQANYDAEVLAAEESRQRSRTNGDDVEMDIRCARPFDRIRRITGYLVGNMDKWNNGKLAEEKDRVKHSV